jgi:O-antigen/teichoic acid export membrane protein
MSGSPIRSLFKHSSIYGVGTIAGQAAGFLLLPLYTRYLTPKDYGIVALVDLVTALISVTVGNGVLNSMARFYHEGEHEADRRRVVSTMFWLMAACSAIAAAILLVAAAPLSDLLFGDPAYRKLFRITAAALGLGFLFDTALLHLVVTKQSTKFVAISLATLILQVTLNIFFLVVMDTGVTGIFLSTLVARGLQTLVITVPTIGAVGTRFSAPLATSMLRYSVPLVFSSLFRLGGTESDKYFINHFVSPAQTGIYALAGKIASALHTMVTTSFLRSYNPARFEIMKQPDAPRTFARILDHYLLLVVSVGLALALAARDIVRLMATPPFHEAATYVPFLVIGWVLFGMRYHFETGLLIRKQTQHFGYINALTAALSITLNYVLVSRFQVRGALLSLILTQLVTTLLFFVMSQRAYPIPFNGSYFLRLALLAGSILGVGQALPTMTPLLSMLASAGLLGVYLVGLRLTGLMQDGMLNEVRSAVSWVLSSGRFPRGNEN